MRKLIFILFLFFVLFANESLAIPLNLDASTHYTSPPKIDGFTYRHGSIDAGFIVLSGTHASLEFESELQLIFKEKILTSSIIILGPVGLDSNNCIASYKKVVRELNKKYGHFQHQIIEKDPLIYDLISSSICHPVQVGLYEISTYWKVLNTHVVVSLVSEDSDFFIEIEYIYKTNSRKVPKLLRKIL